MKQINWHPKVDLTDAYKRTNARIQANLARKQGRQAPEWQKVPSVRTGGKTFFHLQALTEYRGFRRVLWDHVALAWGAHVDRKYSATPHDLGTFRTVALAKVAAEGFEVAP